MSFTIQISPEIEQRVAQAAREAGLSPDIYVNRLIQQGLSQSSPKQAISYRLSKEESAVIQRINSSFSSIDWPYYQTLIEKRQNEALTAEEQSVLIDLSDQVEAINSERLSAVVDLAELWNTSIDAVIDRLELKTRQHG
ncbi:MAG: hypothetical protein AAFQ63_02220 [Cyanobacteria bacterium J06621_11]